MIGGALSDVNLAFLSVDVSLKISCARQYIQCAELSVQIELNVQYLVMQLSGIKKGMTPQGGN